MTPSISRLLAAAVPLVLSAAACTAAEAVSLAPHRAVYDLSLTSQTGDIADAGGRIALELKAETCGVFDLSYRFVARFAQTEETVVTDQRTTSRENLADRTFEFSTETFVDGVAEAEIQGSAVSRGDVTTVRMTKPEPGSLDLPLSVFPLQHTVDLVEKALAGEKIVEASLFDGDDEAEKLLTSTAIIGPMQGGEAPPAPGSSGPEKPDASSQPADIAEKLSSLKSWQISESYYNSDSNADGLPVFRTSYVLYENGVSDRLVLDYGTYAFEGGLSQLDMLEAPRCE